jgi:hypothetical protein
MSQSEVTGQTNKTKMQHDVVWTCRMQIDADAEERRYHT